MSAIVLLVDDNPRLLSGLRTALEMEIDGVQVVTAANGNDALNLIRRARPDLIVSDILMPHVHGFAFLEYLRANPEWADIPFLFITAVADSRVLEKAERLGADNVIRKPFAPREFAQTIRARLTHPTEKNADETAHSTIEPRTLARTIREWLARETRLPPGVSGMVDALVSITAANQVYGRRTAGRLERIAAYANAIGQQWGWNPAELAQLNIAAMLHDIGLFLVPAQICHKLDPLSPQEEKIFRQHPVLGARLLATLKDEMPMVVQAARHHHEQSDGKGYPDGLAADQIPIAARIIAVADNFDLLTTGNTDQGTTSPARAIARMRTEFSPKCDSDFVAALAYSLLLREPVPTSAKK